MTNSIINSNLTINTTEGPTHFELISVVKHIGPSSNSGHYICYRKSEEGWFEVNDDSIRIINISTMETANLFIYKQKNECMDFLIICDLFIRFI